LAPVATLGRRRDPDLWGEPEQIGVVAEVSQGDANSKTARHSRGNRRGKTPRRNWGTPELL